MQSHWVLVHANGVIKKGRIMLDTRFCLVCKNSVDKNMELCRLQRNSFSLVHANMIHAS